MEAFVPLAAPDLTGNERKYLLQAFDSGYLTHQGEWEDRFEKEFGRWIGRPALATSSGTGALHLALLSLGVGPGDEVIVPNLTFGATAAVVVQCGATPVFIDVDSHFGIRWDHVKGKISRRTKAVIAVHLYGEVCEIPSLSVPVIEDACEALGIVEPQGHLAAFSFYGNKPMTTGEGGMLVGNLGNAQKFRDGGFTSDYDVLVPGLNYRMTNLQGAIGCAQLERLPELVKARLDNAAFYAENLKGLGKWLFVADCDNPTQVQAHLRANGVDSRPVFRPLHMTQAFRTAGKFPMSVKLWERGLCLPTGPHVTRQQQEKICELIHESIHIQRSAKRSSELAEAV